MSASDTLELREYRAIVACMRVVLYGDACEDAPCEDDECNACRSAARVHAYFRPTGGTVAEFRIGSPNISVEAETPIVEALAGASVYQMEVDSDVAVPGDVGLGLAVCLGPPADLEFAVSRATDGTIALYLGGTRLTSAKPMGPQQTLHMFTVSASSLREAMGDS